ncbi:hypothetical protein GA0070624_4096 [Micromonospora rhizosphaerae]|uniref:Matrixin n=1 Tax=Micromonospora rhizosphaerae TaxID=568872 RepID=A0A1C6SLY6_9ACTN|nr:hypothetical protein [Micromonospora rhizosphaerae]SCL30540.1 hypothetical protein GA0070624_4096 [Micromonospora rhizosphaerae]
MNTIKIVRIFLATLLAAAGFVVVTPSAGQAHTVSTYFTRGRWPSNASIAYGLNTGFPTGAWRSRVWDGKEQWNNATNSGEPTVFWTLADDVNHGTAGNPCGISGVNTGAGFWNNLDYLSTSTLGATRLCTGSGTIYNFTIEFDSTRSNWYNGTGDNPGGNADFWSTATHEFGHALGFWEHIAESDSACPDDSTRSTMCPTIYNGTERQRTVATHDIHTYDGAY